MTDLIINEKFRDLLDIPSEGERKQLEAQLIRDGGARDPLTIWKGHNVIVDGHNRYAICKANDLTFTTIEREFEDDKAVERWILENQLARRNLTPARYTYFLGTLYNSQKQDPTKARVATEDGKSTAEKLGEQFGVDERTVRRAGDEVKGLETVAEVKGLQTIKDKLAVLSKKNAEGFTKGELAEIGAVKDPVVAVEAAKIMVAQKKTVAETKKAPKPAAPAPAAKPQLYPVIFAKPEFDKIGWSVTTEERPAMADNCMVYMAVPDEELANGMELLKKWGLKYEASFIFKNDRYEGNWSDITHMFLLAGSKGVMAGPKKAVQSLNASNGSVESGMIKLIEAYHPGVKRFDARKRVTADGWDGAKKAA